MPGESETMAKLRRDHPELFGPEEASAAEAPAPAAPPATEEPQFNTQMGGVLARRYTDALSNKWYQGQRNRIVDEAGQGGDYGTYLERMRRLQDRLPEVQRLNRERMTVR